MQTPIPHNKNETSVRPGVPKILVVNDDAGSLLALVGLLSEWSKEIGCDVLAARSGEEALRQVLQNDFAAILLDVNMPGMDGFETARAIHMRERSASVPIIFITAYHSDEMDRLKGYQNGAADYLFTPIIPQILKAKLSVFVAIAMKNIELQAQADVLDKRRSELADINARLELEISERKLVEQQNKAKDDFLAMLSHELRNPLAAITSAASILNVGSVSGEQLNYAKGVIQRQSQHLKRIVDDLLDLSRILSGKILLDMRQLEISKLVEACVETLKITGRTRTYTLNVQMEAAWMNGDPARVEQIIVNLLDNAIKYTPAGGVIDIEVRAEEDDVVFKVRDSGVGIEEDLLPFIFDVFVQGDKSLDRTSGGLGIGLSLVRQLVKLHGGTVSAASKGLGCGSVFVVRMPRTAERKTAVFAAAIEPEEGKSTILLVEDNEDGRDTMAMLLAAHGNRVLTAMDGISGIRMASECRPDIALIDIGLPGMNGYEVARQLRANPATSDIKLVALTGYGQKNDRSCALDAGFDMYLVKPVSWDDVNEVLTACRYSA